jgi:hypothetical protein
MLITEFRTRGLLVRNTIEHLTGLGPVPILKIVEGMRPRGNQ